MSKGIYLDIETIPCQDEEGYKAKLAETIKAPATMKKPETISAWHNGEGSYEGVKEKLINESYLKTSFDGSLGEVISISWAIDDGEVQAVSRLDYEDENAMLASFFLRLAKESSIDYFIGHNIRFDLEFLWKRAVVNGLNPGVKLKWQGRHGTSFFCTQEAWAGFKNYISQDNLCAILGLEQKPDGIDGSKVYAHYLEGKMQEIVDYNKYDVGTVREIYKRVSV
jgi:predicted PolB exonuclease-like 3'-5' exonuclease